MKIKQKHLANASREELLVGLQNFARALQQNSDSSDMIVFGKLLEELTDFVKNNPGNGLELAGHTAWMGLFYTRYLVLWKYKAFTEANKTELISAQKERAFEEFRACCVSAKKEFEQFEREVSTGRTIMQAIRAGIEERKSKLWN